MRHHLFLTCLPTLRIPFSSTSSSFVAFYYYLLLTLKNFFPVTVPRYCSSMLQFAICFYLSSSCRNYPLFTVYFVVPSFAIITSHRCQFMARRAISFYPLFLILLSSTITILQFLSSSQLSLVSAILSFEPVGSEIRKYREIGKCRVEKLTVLTINQFSEWNSQKLHRC